MTKQELKQLLENSLEIDLRTDCNGIWAEVRLDGDITAVSNIIGYDELKERL